MGFLDRLRGKKAEEEKGTKKVEEVTTGLEAVCSNDKEAYEALAKIMLLDPRKVGMSIEDAAEKAKHFEKQRDNLKATMWYQLAGGLAIYRADVKNVKKYFAKCAKLSPDTSYTILKIPERAVAKAQEYYQKYLKE